MLYTFNFERTFTWLFSSAQGILGFIFTRVSVLHMTFPKRMVGIVNRDFPVYDFHHTKFAQNQCVVVSS